MSSFPAHTVSLRALLVLCMLALCISPGVLASGEADAGHGASDGAPVKVVQVHFAGLGEELFTICVFVLVAISCVMLFHNYPALTKRVPESALLILVGAAFGGVLRLFQMGTGSDGLPLTFDPEVFFLILIPPIIVEAGYLGVQKAFFVNLGTISLFAVVNTLFNTLMIGSCLYGVAAAGGFTVSLTFVDAMLFASLMSAVDPVAVLAIFDAVHVNETLNMLVFGESMLNDAVSIVLYRLFESLRTVETIDAGTPFLAIAKFFVVSLGGVLVGIVFALLSAMMCKHTHHLQVLVPVIVIVCSLLSYVVAEILSLSGIMAILFCGVGMAHWTDANMTRQTHAVVKYVLKMLSTTAETIVFMFLGVATALDSYVLDWSLAVLTLVFCLLWRFVGIFSLTALANRKRIKPIPVVDQLIMAYGGLRGAIAFALAFVLPESLQARPAMLFACLFNVFFTVFVQGSTVKPIIGSLHVSLAKAAPDDTLAKKVFMRGIKQLRHGMDVIASDEDGWRMRWKEFDTKYIGPLVLTQRGQESALVRALLHDEKKEAKEKLRQLLIEGKAQHRSKFLGPSPSTMEEGRVDVEQKLPMSLDQHLHAKGLQGPKHGPYAVQHTMDSHPGPALLQVPSSVRRRPNRNGEHSYSNLEDVSEDSGGLVQERTVDLMGMMDAISDDEDMGHETHAYHPSHRDWTGRNRYDVDHVMHPEDASSQVLRRLRTSMRALNMHGQRQSLKDLQHTHAAHLGGVGAGGSGGVGLADGDSPNESERTSTPTLSQSRMGSHHQHMRTNARHHSHHNGTPEPQRGPSVTISPAGRTGSTMTEPAEEDQTYEINALEDEVLGQEQLENEDVLQSHEELNEILGYSEGGVKMSPTVKPVAATRTIKTRKTTKRAPSAATVRKLEEQKRKRAEKAQKEKEAEATGNAESNPSIHAVDLSTFHTTELLDDSDEDFSDDDTEEEEDNAL